MIVASLQSTLTRGDVLLAVPIAFAAGILSFFTPCVLPLVPGYVAFLGGTTGADSLGDRPQPHPARAATGALVFVAGFSLVEVSLGTVFGGLGRALTDHTRTLEVGFGVLTIAMGVLFSGLLPRASFLNRELRVHWLPPATIVGAGALGVLFGLAWTPCLGPTEAAIIALATSAPGATAWRGTLLVGVYCFGLGMPFVAAALASESFATVSRFARSHARWVMCIGGLLLIGIGVLEVTGWWTTVVQWMQDHAGSYQSPL